MPLGAGRGRPHHPASFDPNLAHAVLGDAPCAWILLARALSVRTLGTASHLPSQTRISHPLQSCAPTPTMDFGHTVPSTRGGTGWPDWDE